MNKKIKANKPIQAKVATKVSLRTKTLLVTMMLASFAIGLSFAGLAFNNLKLSFVENKIFHASSTPIGYHGTSTDVIDGRNDVGYVSSTERMNIDFGNDDFVEFPANSL